MIRAVLNRPPAILSRSTTPRIPPWPRPFCRSFQYLLIEEVERLERYHPGGFHPLKIGDKLNGDYHVVHKLGYGAYSTIWLARDERHRQGKYVAIKVSIADAESGESDILRQCGHMDASGKHPGKDVIFSMLDEFTINGPNGDHRCFVTAPASVSLVDSLESSYNKPFQLPVARAIIAQLIQAVAFLHSRGVVHADLHLGNILLQLPNKIDHLSTEQLYDQYSPPDHEPIVRVDGKSLGKGVPTHAIIPVWFGKESHLLTLFEARILLIDYGESFMPSKTTRLYSNTPANSAPLEVHFEPETSLSFPADMWSLACTIWSILVGRPPFEAFAASNDRMIRDHVALLGKLPPERWGKWDKRLQWFHEDGSPNHHDLERPWAEQFEIDVQRFRRRNKLQVLGDEEKKALLTMLRAMMAFRPGERLTAEEALRSKWMKEWALPELGRMAGCTGTNC